MVDEIHSIEKERPDAASRLVAAFKALIEKYGGTL